MQDEPVPQRKHGSSFDRIRGHKGITVDQAIALAGTHQRQRSARAGTQQHVIMVPRGCAEPHNVFAQRFINVYIADLLLASSGYPPR